MKNLIAFGALISATLLSGTPQARSDEHSHHHGHGSVKTAPQACSSWSKAVSAEQVESIAKVMANRGHRMQHALWHGVRGMDEAERKQVIRAYGASWNPKHMLCPPPVNNATSDDYNASGEDFLFMHREMIEMVRAQLAADGLSCILGWDQVPSAKAWPLPDAVRTGAKSDEALARLRRWDASFQDKDWLRGVSLSQMGWALEFTVHNNLHMRYATENPPEGFSPDGAPVPFAGGLSANLVTYDDPRYNWLADPYGAALNPMFWKIHGYVDNLIDKWLAANHYKSVAVDCQGRHDCYTWKGTWSGNAVVVPKGTIGSPRGNGSESDREFNRQRMAHQRVGVLTAQDLVPAAKRNPGGPITAPNPADDPLAFTAQRLCGK